MEGDERFFKGCNKNNKNDALVIKNSTTISFGDNRYEIYELRREEPKMLCQCPDKDRLCPEVERIVECVNCIQLIATRPEATKIIGKSVMKTGASKWSTGPVTVFHLNHQPGPGILLS